VILCDLCGEAKECRQREINGREFDICADCWRPLQEKLSGKGRVKRKRDMVLLPPAAPPEGQPEVPRPIPGKPPKISLSTGRCRALSTRRESWARAREGCRQPSSRSGVESRRAVAGRPRWRWFTRDRRAQNLRNRSRCQRTTVSARTYTGERASRSTAGTAPPRIVGRRKSMWVASVFSGGNELNAESGVLHRDGDVTAQEESHETKQGQDEDRHEPRFLVSPALKVKSLPADRLLASRRPRTTNGHSKLPRKTGTRNFEDPRIGRPGSPAHRGTSGGNRLHSGQH
jgi:hypothetical protein